MLIIVTFLKTIPLSRPSFLYPGLSWPGRGIPGALISRQIYNISGPGSNWVIIPAPRVARRRHKQDPDPPDLHVTVLSSPQCPVLINVLIAPMLFTYPHQYINVPGDRWLVQCLGCLYSSKGLFYRVVPADQGFHSQDDYAGIFR